MTPRLVAKQLSNPTGLGGAIIQFLMNRGNARLNDFAAGQLALQEQDRVLEIGFGGGVALAGLLSRSRRVWAVDRSSDVVASAQRRFSAAIKTGAADFRVGAVEDLPFPAAAFDAALTVNTVYFWKSLEAGMQELRRVLAPGGRLAIGFVPKVRMDRMKMPLDIFTPRTPEAVTDALRQADFNEIEIRELRGPEGPLVVTGVRNAVC